MSRTSFLAVAIVSALLVSNSADASVITFDDVQFQTPVDGLTIGNVKFGFSGTDAAIAGGPGTTMFVDDPSIEGDALGTLTFGFADPVFEVSYGFALSDGSVNPGSSMEIFDPLGVSLGVFTSPAANFGFAFSEGLVSATSDAPIGSAVVTFGGTSRFAVDNLRTTSIPEPASLITLGIGVIVWTSTRRRKL